MNTEKLVSPIILLLILVLTGVTAHAEQVPLEVRVTPWSLAKGYTIAVLMRAESHNYPFFHAWGDAGVIIGPLTIMIDGKGTSFGTEFYLVVKYNGQEVLNEKIADFGWLSGSDEVQLSFTISADCYGNVEIKRDDTGAVIFKFRMDRDAYKIYEMEDYGTPDLSDVDVRLVQDIGCGVSATPPPTPTPPDTQTSTTGHPGNVDPEKLALVGIGLAVAVVGVMLAFSSRRGGA